MLATNRHSTRLRPIEPADVHALLRLIDTAWRVHLRLSPTELPVKIKHNPGILAEDRVGVRGFFLFELLPSGVALVMAAGLRDTWGVTPYLDLMLPHATAIIQAHQLDALVYIGQDSWLTEALTQRGFQTREWIVAYERHGIEPPPQPVLQLADLRTAHYNDLPALLTLDDLAFDHIWHKSAGNFSQALARADSFTVALMDEQIVAYQWCELYHQHAHLTRLAVHPAYQGRGIGAQLLHRAISDALSLGANLITLNTQETNQRSQTLYERFGFVHTQQRMPVMWLELT